MIKDFSSLEKRAAALQDDMLGGNQKKPLRKIFDGAEQPVVERKGRFVVDATDEGFDAQDLVMNKSSLFSGENKAAVEQFQDINDTAKMISDLTRIPVEETDYWQSNKKKLQKTSRILAKAMDTAESTGGTEWCPTTYSSKLMELLALDLRIAPLFEHIQMPRSPFSFPVVSGRPTIYLGSQQTADEGTKTTETNPTTSTFTLTAKKLNARVAFSEELEEDSIAPIVPMLRRNLAYHMARGLDDAILNGDVSADHFDADVSTTTDRRAAFRGLRFHAYTNGFTTDLSTFSAANLRALISVMRDYGIDDPASNLAFIAGSITINKQLRNLGNELRTVDEYGPGVSFMRGEVGRFDGIPIIASPVCREDLNATGNQDLTTTNKAVISLVHRRFNYVGVIRDVRLRIWESTLYDQKHIIVDWRGAFGTPYTSGVDGRHTVLGVNIATT